MRAFGRDPAKRDALGALMQRLADALTQSGALPPPRGAAGPGPEPVLAPQALQWALFYQAQHHDWLGNTGVTAQSACGSVQTGRPSLPVLKGWLLPCYCMSSKVACSCVTHDQLSSTHV